MYSILYIERGASCHSNLSHLLNLFSATLSTHFPKRQLVIYKGTGGFEQHTHARTQTHTHYKPPRLVCMLYRWQCFRRGIESCPVLRASAARPSRCGASWRFSTSPLRLTDELSAYVCVSPARPESDGGARPESVHPSVGENSPAPRVLAGHSAVSVRLPRREGKGSGPGLHGDVRRQQLHQLLQSVQLKVIWIQQRAPTHSGAQWSCLAAIVQSGEGLRGLNCQMHPAYTGASCVAYLLACCELHVSVWKKWTVSFNKHIICYLVSPAKLTLAKR